MIYDCFIFFNELDLLEIRLNVLDYVVDKFVLVEATRTHTGKEKDLYFENNKKRFSKFLDKIIHIIVDDMPVYEGNAWILEHYQRNAISRGLEGCNKGDVILISDVDEIPRPEKILEYAYYSGIKVFRQNMYYYFLNCLNKSIKWCGTLMVQYPLSHPIQYYRENTLLLSNVFDKNFLRAFYYWLKKWRFEMSHSKIIFVDNGGWHFSYLGGIESVIKKIESFSHTEYNQEKFKNRQYIEMVMNSGKDIFGRAYSYEFVKIDESYPFYIRQNMDKYKHLIK